MPTTQLVTMEWSIGHLILNAALFAVAFMLYRKAPCWMQRVVMALFLIAFATLATGYGSYTLGVCELPHFGHVFWLINIGYFIEHLGVVLYVCRLAMDSLRQLHQRGLQHDGPSTVHP